MIDTEFRDRAVTVYVVEHSEILRSADLNTEIYRDLAEARAVAAAENDEDERAGEGGGARSSREAADD